MSQSGLTDPSRQSDWEAWYVEHLDIMRGVPGIMTAQRFTTEDPGHPPSLAMYTVTSVDVFSDPRYLRVRGMGEWAPLVDRRHYRRNLFEGLAAAPTVRDGELLAVADRPVPDASLSAMAWMEAVALDRSTPVRGIAVVHRREARTFADRNVGLYAPVPVGRARGQLEPERTSGNG